MLEIHLVDSETHRGEAGKSLREFYGKGAGEYLLTHLMLQDLLEYDDGFSAKQVDLYLAMRDKLMPLFLKLESGLSDIILSEGRGPDLTGLFLVLGAYTSPETLPLLLKGLEWCTGTALNEAVLALVKTGYHHPREATTAVRERIEGDLVQEGLINAVEVLGLLGPLESNYDYLKSRAKELSPQDYIQHEMIMFTAGALQRSGEPGLVEESARLIEQITPFLDYEEAAQAHMLLEIDIDPHFSFES